MKHNPLDLRDQINADFQKSLLNFNSKGVSSAAQAASQWLEDHAAIDFQTFFARLKRTLQTGVDADAETLVFKLIDALAEGHASLSLDQAESVILLLRRECHFAAAARLGDRLISIGLESLKIRRVFAHALIETGNLFPAIYLLEHVAEDAEREGNRDETSEAYGLLGRCYKQMYVDCAGCVEISHEHLRAAVQCYWELYSDPLFSDYSERTWHGVNLATLGRIATENSVPIPKAIQWQGIAKEVIEMVEQQLGEAYVESIDQGKELDTHRHWKLATLAEANIALGNYDVALEQMARFADEHHSRLRFAGTLRQFEQVVRLDPRDQQQGAIIHFLRAMTLNNREECELIVSNSDSELSAVDAIAEDPVRFEGIFGTARFKTYLWYRTGLQRALSVAKITDTFGSQYGTGFLVDGSSIHQSLARRKVLVTNAHVVSPDAREQRNAFGEALAPEEARVVFEATGTAKEYVGMKPAFTSSRDHLDFTVLTFDREPSEPSIPMTTDNPRGDDRVYIIGHPKGAGLSFSIQDNQIVEIETSKIRYQTPTQSGNSGSPLFNESWEAFGVHHAEVFKANEGILFKEIISHVASQSLISK